jgi:methylmalonyl-CoA mutase cobalamin-binding subunit
MGAAPTREMKKATVMSVARVVVILCFEAAMMSVLMSTIRTCINLHVSLSVDAHFRGDKVVTNILRKTGVANLRRPALNNVEEKC